MHSIIIILSAFLSVSYGQRGQFAPNQPGNVATILSQTYELSPDGSYRFSYDSSDGSGREENGVPKSPGPEGPAVAAQGVYRYVSDAGPVAVNYVADEYGYQPNGDGVHPSIQKAVAYLVAEAQRNPNNAGSIPLNKPAQLFGRK